MTARKLAAEAIASHNRKRMKVVGVAEGEMSLKVTLSWSPVTQYEDGVPIEEGAVVNYIVLKSLASDMSNAVVLGNTIETTFVDFDVVPNKTYYYGVRAYIVETLESEMSVDFVRTFPPGRPQGVEGVVSR